MRILGCSALETLALREGEREREGGKEREEGGGGGEREKEEAGRNEERREGGTDNGRWQSELSQPLTCDGWRL